MEYYNELYHYGVKGMKWGVRRAREAVKSNDGNRDSDKEYSMFKSKAFKDRVSEQIKNVNDENTKRDKAYFEARNRLYNEKYSKLYDDLNKEYSKKFNSEKDERKQSNLMNEYESKLDKIEKMHNNESKKLTEYAEKWSYDQLQDKYREVYAKELGYADLNKGKEAVKRYMDREFEEQYSKHRGPNY